jgi:polyferredoxin
VDILRLPAIGAFLRWRHVRLASQLALLAVAIVIVVHGFFGPQVAPRNLSTVLTSIHWRGLLVIALVAAGNLTCTACPMVLTRDWGRRIRAPRLSWPRRMRRKWIGLGLLVLVLFSYELFDLWDQPRATAWIVIGYFGLALVVDLLFTGASFCKYVCPIGQFNFIASTMSPTELQVRDGETCRTCRTSDCIKGRKSVAEPVRIVQRGCELGLFLPSKVGNLDCTLCLDCVHACPHDNIALAVRVPGVEVLDARRRSGIGRLTRRPDVAALAIVFTFAALINAFAMTASAFAVQHALAGALHVSSEAVVLGILFVAGLVVAPVVLVVGAAAATRTAAGPAAKPLAMTLQSYAVALIPFGLGVWLAHYGFHFFTGALTILPVTQSAAGDLFGWTVLGEPAWRWAGAEPGSVYPIQLGLVLLGACGSIGLVQAASLRDYPERPALSSAPWFAVILLLAIVAMWILDQPMQMRGMGGMG